MTSTTEMHLEVGLCKVVSGSAGTGLYALVHGSCTVYQLEQTNIPSLGYRHSTESLHAGRRRRVRADPLHSLGCLQTALGGSTFQRTEPSNTRDRLW